MSSNQVKTALAAFFLIFTCSCRLTPEQARAKIEDRGLTFDEAGIGNAVLSPDRKLVKLFITAGYDVNAFDDPRRAPLTQSTRLSQSPTLKLLINAGARAEALPGVLIVPASRGDLRTMSLLLDAGADIDSMDLAWRTAMLGAIETGEVEAVRFLLDNGANPDGGTGVGRHGGNPLIEAIKTNQPETVELLIDAGAKVNTLGGMPIVTPLIAAVRRNQTEAVDRLLAAGADPRMGIRGIDAIQAAERAGHDALANRLRETPAP